MTFYRFALYLWMYLGMAFISLIITLCLDYIKANAQNLRKEIINIIEEKVRDLNIQILDFGLQINF